MSSNTGRHGRRDLITVLAGGALATAIGPGCASAQGQAGARPATDAPQRVVVTGSSGGLGLAAAQRLIATGHRVIVHGRNQQRADDAMAAAPGAEAAVIGDVSVMAQTRALADQVNEIGPCDAVVHNVGIGSRAGTERTADGLPQIFAVNTLAPYMLTALINKPKRLVYVSSDVHRRATLDPDDLTHATRSGSGGSAYAESKLQDVLLAFAVGRRWPGVFSNAMSPGWVPTEMGGPSATGSLPNAADCLAWLATSDAPAARVSAKFFYDKREQKPNPLARDRQLQDRLMAECERISGVRFPA